MNIFRITLRLKKLITLEIFVFLTFLGIAALINALIVQWQSNNQLWNIILGIGKVITSMFLIAIWLGIWYYLTKKIMQPSEKKEKQNNE